MTKALLLATAAFVALTATPALAKGATPAATDYAARVAPIDKLSVVLVAIFGVIFLGERLTAANWLGVALIGAGAILVAYRV